MGIGRELRYLLLRGPCSCISRTSALKASSASSRSILTSPRSTKRIKTWASRARRWVTDFVFCARGFATSKVLSAMLLASDPSGCPFPLRSFSLFCVWAWSLLTCPLCARRLASSCAIVGIIELILAFSFVATTSHSISAALPSIRCPRLLRAIAVALFIGRILVDSTPKVSYLIFCVGGILLPLRGSSLLHAIGRCHLLPGPCGLPSSVYGSTICFLWFSTLLQPANCGLATACVPVVLALPWPSASLCSTLCNMACGSLYSRFSSIFLCLFVILMLRGCFLVGCCHLRIRLPNRVCRLRFLTCVFPRSLSSGISSLFSSSRHTERLRHSSLPS